jgi:hypothetical protein
MVGGKFTEKEIMQLSPLNYFGIAARAQIGVVEDEPTKARRQIEEVVMYRCPECHELHEYEDDAEDCCKDEEEAAARGAGTDCPVCGEKYATHRDASDCCLWKDIDALTRWAIADAVEAGSEWATELGLTPNAKSEPTSAALSREVGSTDGLGAGG